MHLDGVATVHGRKRRPLGALSFALDVVGDRPQVAGRTDDHAHRDIDVEDLAQQVAECQRGQRVSTQVGEVGIGCQVRLGRTEHRRCGPADRLQHRRVGAAATQFGQLVGLAFGQVGVELLQALAVVLLQLRPRQLADAGQQAVFQGELRRLDNEVTRHLVGLQSGLFCDVLQRLSDQRLERGQSICVVGGQRIFGGHHDRQQVGLGAVAVDVNLADQGAVAELCLQLRQGDELTLRELEHVVAAVDIHQPVQTDLGDDVSGAVVAVFVEHAGGDLWPLVVAGEHVLGLEQQLASRIGPVGGEVAQIRNVDQLVVDNRRTLHFAVEQHHACLGGAVPVQQMHLEQRLDPGPQLRGGRCRARHRENVAPAEELLAKLDKHLGLRGLTVGAFGCPSANLALVLAVQHLPDAWHEVQLGGPHQAQVFQQRREVTEGGEVGGTAVTERAVEAAASHDVAHRHEVQGDRHGTWPEPVLGRPVPHLGDVALRVHRALGRAGAARGVDQQGQRVVLVGLDVGGRGQPSAAVADLVQRLDGQRELGHPFVSRLQRRAVVVDLGAVVEDHQPCGRVACFGGIEDYVNRVGEVIDTCGENRGFGLDDDGLQLRDCGAGLQRNRHGADTA